MSCIDTGSKLSTVLCLLANALPSSFMITSGAKKFYFTSPRRQPRIMSLEVDKLIEEFLVESSLVLNAKLMPLFHLKWVEIALRYRSLVSGLSMQINWNSFGLRWNCQINRFYSLAVCLVYSPSWLDLHTDTSLKAFLLIDRFASNKTRSVLLVLIFFFPELGVGSNLNAAVDTCLFVLFVLDRWISCGR